MLGSGSKLGPYEVLALIGSGGMGDVYRARDTRLGRNVAIKVLAGRLSGSLEARERFEREARAISSLSHPYICTLHDIGEQDGIHFLVMEHLDGETLAKRLERGPLPAAEVLKLAIQIVDALDGAHRHGIVHRDLKPGNIMLTKTGVKLLDFGLAKLKPPPVPEPEASDLPTGAGRANLTADGTILGTLQYMSPEQMEGLEADSRSDIWAFGAVLYEMLTGRKAFEGRSTSSVIAAILHVDPPAMTELKPMTPPALERVVKTCLAKDPDARWQTAHDLGLELQWLAEGGVQAGIAVPAAAPRWKRERWAWVLTGAMGFIAVMALVVALRKNEQRPLWVSLAPPANSFGPDPSPALSPDGRQIAFFSPDSNGKSMLWVRDLDSQTARAISGTEGGAFPFWSPDGKSIAFAAVGAGDLKRIDLDGGSPQILAAVSNYRGGTWNRDGVILFVPSTDTIYRVSATGGDAQPLMKPRPGEADFLPSFLPDGKHFLYNVWSEDKNVAGIYAGSLDSAPSRRLIGDANSERAQFASGYLIFGRKGELFAQPFDPATLTLSGEATRLTGNLGSSLLGGFTFSASSSDALVYWDGSPIPIAQLTWTDRAGNIGPTIGDPGEYIGLALAPDGKHVAVEKYSPLTNGSLEIWSIDAETGAASRVGPGGTPVWAHDSLGILSTNFSDKWHVEGPSGNPIEDIPLDSSEPRWIADWSSDGKYIAYHAISAQTDADIWVLPLFGDRKPFPFLQTPFREGMPRFSPDVHWMAYASNETGRFEVYIRLFPAAGPAVRVSINGGDQPTWRGDGKELYFIAPAGKLMAVDIHAGTGGMKTSTPHVLFTIPKLGSFENGRRLYEVSRDGERFLFDAQVPDPSFHTIHLALHWTATLKK